MPSKPETMEPLGLGSGAGGLGCYAIIGIQPCVPVFLSVRVGNDVTEENESHMEGLRDREQRLSVITSECKSVT